ncbi:hypothetical protein HN51_071427 [Arachis hypogaea]
MGILHDDVVIFREAEKEGDPTVITVNCPDKTGLGSDLCRIILFFGLSIVRGVFCLDLRHGCVNRWKWCYIVLWVVGKENTRWSLLKKRLIGACPSCSSASGISYYSSDFHPPKPPHVFLLKFSCYDRKGLLHDVTEALCELELVVKKVKAFTSKRTNLMIKYCQELIHTEKRKEDTKEYLRGTLKDAIIDIDIELVGPAADVCSPASSFLPATITDEETIGNRTLIRSDEVTITMDNTLSPAHTLVQIMCQDHKGLIYDIMRTLKDYNIQICYGRFYVKERGKCDIDLFIITKGDGNKIVDPKKQHSLSSRLRTELLHPVRVGVHSRGPDTELLVANSVELSGKGRPLVFYDITLALNMLQTCIFSSFFSNCDKLKSEDM